MYHIILCVTFEIPSFALICTFTICPCRGLDLRAYCIMGEGSLRLLRQGIIVVCRGGAIDEVLTRRDVGVE